MTHRARQAAWIAVLIIASAPATASARKKGKKAKPSKSPAAEVIVPALPTGTTPSDADKARAEEAFGRAQEFYSRGDNQAALFAAEAAYKYLPNASTALVRATILSDMKRRTDAFSAYLVASDLAPTEQEQALIDDGLEKLGKRLGYGWIVVTTEPTGAKVTVDGVTFKAPRIIGVRTGRHEFVVEAAGYLPSRGRFEVARGVGQRLDMVLNPEPTEPDPIIPDPPKDPPKPPPDDTLGTAGWASVAAGSALLAGGLGMNIWAMDAAADTDKWGQPVQGVSESDRQSRYNSAKSDAETGRIAAWALYGIGGAAVITGVVLLLLPEPEGDAKGTVDVKSTTLAPTALPGGGGVVWQGSF